MADRRGPLMLSKIIYYGRPVEWLKFTEPPPSCIPDFVRRGNILFVSDDRDFSAGPQNFFFPAGSPQLVEPQAPRIFSHLCHKWI